MDYEFALLLAFELSASMKYFPEALKPFRPAIRRRMTAIFLGAYRLHSQTHRYFDKTFEGACLGKLFY